MNDIKTINGFGPTTATACLGDAVGNIRFLGRSINNGDDTYSTRYFYADGGAVG